MNAGGFAQRPAGSINTGELVGKLDAARVVVADLRHDLGELRTQAGRKRHGGLVELDIGRALIALGAANLALERGRRNAGLEP